jgi:hypothetical protein
MKCASIGISSRLTGRRESVHLELILPKYPIRTLLVYFGQYKILQLKKQGLELGSQYRSLYKYHTFRTHHHRILFPVLVAH